MRYIELSPSDYELLLCTYRKSEKHHLRQRCHAILLSHEGKQVKEIATLFKVRTRTIYTWMNRWNKEGLIGLSIKEGRGLKPKLDKSNEETVSLVKKK